MRSRRLFALLLGLAASAAGLGAETHRYTPRVFYDTVSGAHPPALRIKSGDRVITTTVDDTGGGADGTALAKGLNPQTGPFFVEGAEPGDLLVVTIEKLVPNRATGTSTSTMAAHTVAPGALSSQPDATRFPWAIDTVKGVVRLDLQAALPRVRWGTRFASAALEVPLKPTLGSIGVAPPGKASMPSTVPGTFGGNMMSASLSAGAVVMLPVFEPGALLFLGHGLAAKGDGNVTGTGVETSMNVEFSVQVVKKKEWPHSSVARASTVVGEFEQGWPRIETADYVMTVGSASTLQEAFQRATLELHHWLDDDFGLSEKSVSILVGQAIEYEIANLVEPNYTVVAKTRKAALPRPETAPPTLVSD